MPPPLGACSWRRRRVVRGEGGNGRVGHVFGNEVQEGNIGRRECLKLNGEGVEEEQQVEEEVLEALW